MKVAHAGLHGDSALLRVLGFWALTAAIVNLSIGASTFVLPGILAGSLGAAAPWVFVLGALVFVPIALCFAAAGSRVTETGGPYVYVRAAAGRMAGFVVAAVFWISNAAGTAGIAAALVDQAGLLIPFLGPPIPRALLVIVMYGALCAVNARGIRVGGGTVMVLTVLKILPLLALALIGPFFIHRANLHVSGPLEWSSIGSAMVIVIFAYSGLESALVPGGEFKNSNRMVPLATLSAVAVVVSLYIALQVVAQGVLGPALPAAPAPLALIAGTLLPGGHALILMCAGLSMFACLQGDLLGSSRLIFALGRDGYLPSAFAQVTPVRRVPLLALISHALAVGLLTIGGSFASLALISGGAFCLVYFSVCLAVWQLQRTGTSQQSRPFVLWGGALIPLIACGGLTVVLLTLHAKEWRAMGYALLPALLLYGFVRLRGGGPRANGEHR